MANKKTKSPVYKKWWFWVICVLLLAGIVNRMGGRSGNEVKEEPASLAADRTLPDELTEETAEPTQKPSPSPRATSSSSPAPTPSPTPAPTPAPTPTPTPAPTSTPTPAPTSAQIIHGVSADTIVYVSQSGKIHSVHDCSGMKSYKEMTIAEAEAKGYEYCSNCW